MHHVIIVYVIKNVFNLLCFVVARPWSAEERSAVMRQLGHLIHLRRAPRMHDYKTAVLKEPALATRTWKSLKDHIASKIRYARINDQKRRFM